jgi:hypothetical protein
MQTASHSEYRVTRTRIPVAKELLLCAILAFALSDFFGPDYAVGQDSTAIPAATDVGIIGAGDSIEIRVVGDELGIPCREDSLLVAMATLHSLPSAECP